MIMRPISVVLAATTLLLCAATSTGAAPAASTPSVLQTQTVTGGGTGLTGPNAAFDGLVQTGSYTSTGQLGSGQFSFEDHVVEGAARFTRADGMEMRGTARPVDPCKESVPADAYCEHIELDGTADIAHAKLDLVVVDKITSHGIFGTVAFLMRGTLTLNQRIGYAMVDANGTTYAFGGVDHLGDARTSFVTDIEPTPSHQGYWIVNAFGQVFAFGDAQHLGNADIGNFAPDELVTSMSATPTGKGYWLFTSKGRAVTFGDAHFFGDMHATPLNGRIVGSIATPTGNGYYMVGSDGGVFAFGDATFHGSTGAMRLNQPVVGIVPTADNTGYWLVASDGGVFSFDAPFHGSMGGTPLNRPIVTMVRYGASYLMVASDGGVFNFSTRPFFGSLGSTPLPAPTVGALATG